MDSISYYLRYGYINSRTIYEDIKQVSASQFIEIGELILLFQEVKNIGI